MWKGFGGNTDFKEIILHIDKVVADYDFTLDLVKELIKSLYSDTEGYYEDKKDLDEVLKGMIKEISDDFEPFNKE